MAKAESFCDIAAPCNACGALVYVGTSWRGDTLDIDADGSVHNCGLPMPEMILQVRERPVSNRKRLKLAKKKPKPPARTETIDRVREDVIQFVSENPGCNTTDLRRVRGQMNLVANMAKELADNGVIQRQKAHRCGYSYYPLDEAA